MGTVTSTLANAFWKNIIIFFTTLTFSLPLGLFLSFFQLSRLKAFRFFSNLLIWIIRGTPLLLQLFLVFYVPGLCFGHPFRSRMAATLIAFIVNYSAYFSEIFRGAILNIDASQKEAAICLGLPRGSTFFYVIFPQALKGAIAPIGNEVTTLVKDTSLARVIAIKEILMVASEYTSKGIIWPVFYTGVFFLIGSFLCTFAFSRIETHLRSSQ